MTAWASDDLASVLIAPDLEFAGWGQGIIKAWNPDTFENVVSYRGGEHENLAVASGLEALTYVPGDVVMLSRWQPSGGGAVVPRIGAGGRVIIPGAGAAEQAIAALRTNLAREISAEIFAERIESAYTSNSIPLADTAFAWVSDVDGPSVAVNVSTAGTMLIWVDAWIHVSTTDLGESGGECSPEISGATSIAAGVLDRRELTLQRGTNTVDTTINLRGSTMFIATGLNEGVHTVEVKYRAFVSGGGDDVTIAQRGLVVIAL